MPMSPEAFGVPIDVVAGGGLLDARDSRGLPVRPVSDLRRFHPNVQAARGAENRRQVVGGLDRGFAGLVVGAIAAEGEGRRADLSGRYPLRQWRADERGVVAADGVGRRSARSFVEVIYVNRPGESGVIALATFVKAEFPISFVACTW